MRFRIVLLFLTLATTLTACTPSASPSDAPKATAALIAAIGADDSVRVATLLAEGAPLNDVDSTGWTPLAFAAAQGKTALVRRLLDAGAAVDARTGGTYQGTALMNATANNSLDIARMLIARGADVDAVDALGDPALNWAAFYGHADFVSLLLDHDANPRQPSKHGDNTLAIALKEWNPNVVAVLIERGAGQALSPEARPLVEAVRAGDAGAVTAALRAGANPDQRDEAGSPVLVVAATNGNADLIARLLDAGADVNAMNAVGQTALTQAVYFGHTALADQLLAKGADVNRTDDRFRLTALMAAARAGRPALAQRLLRAGADLEATDGINGFTPLLWATIQDRPAVARVLLAAGANVDHRSAYDFTALDVASDSLRVLLEASGR